MRPTVELKPIKRKIPIRIKADSAAGVEASPYLIKVWPRPVASWLVFPSGETDTFSAAFASLAVDPSTANRRPLQSTLQSSPEATGHLPRHDLSRDTVNLHPIPRRTFR